MNDEPLISRDEAVCDGLPCIAGTRITVGDILDRLSEWGSISGVRGYYRNDKITREAIRACLSYAYNIVQPGEKS